MGAAESRVTAQQLARCTSGPTNDRGLRREERRVVRTAAEGIGDGAHRESTEPFQHRVRVSAGVATRSPEIAAVWKRRCALHGQPPGSHAQRAGRDGRTHALQMLPEEEAGGERKTRETAGPAQRARLVVHGVPAGHRMGAFERAVVFSGCPE